MIDVERSPETARFVKMYETLLRYDPMTDVTGSVRLAAAVFAGRDAHPLSRLFVDAIYHRWFRDRSLVWC